MDVVPILRRRAQGSANLGQHLFGLVRGVDFSADGSVPFRCLPVHHLPVMLPQHLHGVVGLHASPLESPKRCGMGAKGVGEARSGAKGNTGGRTEYVQLRPAFRRGPFGRINSGPPVAAVAAWLFPMAGYLRLSGCYRPKLLGYLFSNRSPVPSCKGFRVVPCFESNFGNVFDKG
jgi:hypothetical protein